MIGLVVVITGLLVNVSIVAFRTYGCTGVSAGLG